MVEGLTNLIEFFVLFPKVIVFLPKLLQLVLVVEALLGQLPDLNLIVLGIEKLPLRLFQLHPQ